MLTCDKVTDAPGLTPDDVIDFPPACEITVMSLATEFVTRSIEAQPVRQELLLFASYVARLDVPINLPPAMDNVITPLRLMVFACCVPAPKPNTLSAESP